MLTELRHTYLCDIPYFSRQLELIAERQHISNGKQWAWTVLILHHDLDRSAEELDPFDHTTLFVSIVSHVDQGTRKGCYERELVSMDNS